MVEMPLVRKLENLATVGKQAERGESKFRLERQLIKTQQHARSGAANSEAPDHQRGNCRWNAEKGGGYAQCGLVANTGQVYTA